MELESYTQIQYTIKTKSGDRYTLKLTMEQLEGSSPCFIEQVRDALGLSKNEEFKIVEREILTL